MLFLPVSPDRYGGAAWAVPLWSQRRLSGILLLGEKSDAGLYTQEEIEIAQKEFDFGVEWQIDPQAAQTASRLPAFALQVLYFGAQELLRNVARHAGNGMDGPLRVVVALIHREGIELVVEDNGTGLRPQTGAGAGQTAGARSGLRLHSAMLAALGASLEINALPQRGTRAVIQLSNDAIDQLSAR